MRRDYGYMLPGNNKKIVIVERGEFETSCAFLSSIERQAAVKVSFAFQLPFHSEQRLKCENLKPIYTSFLIL